MGDNDPQFDWPLASGRRGREVWYGLVSHPDRPVAFWFRYTLLSTGGGTREARLWAALTRGEDPDRSFLVTRPALLEAATVTRDPFRLRFGDGELTDASAEGRIAAGDGATDPRDVAWYLEYDPDRVTFTPLRSRVLTDVASSVLGTGHHWSANQSVRMTGEVVVGDERIHFEDAPGHQGHTVGAAAPPQWRWVHCNAFENDSVVLEALDLDGTVSICLRENGRVHRLNRIAHLYGPRANATREGAPGRWRFEGQGDGAVVEATVTAPSEHWQRASYLVPDDTTRYNAHCSLAAVEVTYSVGTEERTLTSGAGRAEWAATEPPVPGAYRPFE